MDIDIIVSLDRPALVDSVSNADKFLFARNSSF